MRKIRPGFRLLSLLLIAAVLISVTFVRIFREYQKHDLENRMIQAISAADYHKAQNIGEQLAWYQPLDPTLMKRRAEIATRLNEPENAVIILEEFPDSAPDAAIVALQRGLLLRELFRIDDAVESLRKAVRLDSRLAQAHRVLVGMLGVSRRSEDQKNALINWLRSGSGSVEALRLLAQSDVVIPPGTLAKTIDEGYVLEKQLKIEPDSLHVRPPLARFYRNRGEIEKAITLLDQRLRKAPQDVAAGLEKLACLVEMGETSDADQLINQLESKLSANSEYRLIRARHCLNQKNWQQAQIELKRSMELNTEPAEPYFLMAQCCRALAELNESEKYLAISQSIRELAELAAAVDPNDPRVEDMVAVMIKAESLGRTMESAGWATEILRRDHSHAEAKAVLQKAGERQ